MLVCSSGALLHKKGGFVDLSSLSNEIHIKGFFSGNYQCHDLSAQPAYNARFRFIFLSIRSSRGSSDNKAFYGPKVDTFL